MQKRLILGFWKPESFVDHWYISLASPKYAHCAILLGHWYLGTWPEGNAWVSLKDPNTEERFRKPDAAFDFGPTDKEIDDYKYLESTRLPVIDTLLFNIIRESTGHALYPKPQNNCVRCCRQVLGLWDDNIQTPDELYERVRNEKTRMASHRQEAD